MHCPLTLVCPIFLRKMLGCGIAESGPILIDIIYGHFPAHLCEPLIKEALDYHFLSRSKKGSAALHFSTNDSRSTIHGVSEVIDRLKREQSKFEFMN